MPAKYLRLEPGKRYRDRAYEIEVLSRTAKTAIIRDIDGRVRRCSIMTVYDTDVTEEYIRLDNYFQFRASREVKP